MEPFPRGCLLRGYLGKLAYSRFGQLLVGEYFWFKMLLSKQPPVSLNWLV